jgi:hypothetical protein
MQTPSGRPQRRPRRTRPASSSPLAVSLLLHPLPPPPTPSPQASGWRQLNSAILRFSFRVPPPLHWPPPPRGASRHPDSGPTSYRQVPAARPRMAGGCQTGVPVHNGRGRDSPLFQPMEQPASHGAETGRLLAALWRLTPAQLANSGGQIFPSKHGGPGSPPRWLQAF